jgi:dipeptidyl aminopeptidase/acylaminoacyl peptidase
MKFSARLARSIAVACLLLANAAHTQTQVRTPSSAAISPDGATIAWSVNDHGASQLHLTDRAKPDPATEKIISPNAATDCSNDSPTWSPDSQSLAYTSTCTSTNEKPGQAQIFLWSRTTGESRQLTHLTGLFKQAAWSPDGKSIAFLFVENASRSSGALDAMKPWSGVIGEDGVEIQRVYAVNVADGEGYWLTRDALHVYEFSWAPNSNEITFIAADPPGENNWWIAKLYRSLVPHHKLPIGMVCVTSDIDKTPCPAGDEEVVFDPAKTTGPLHGLQIAVPRFSPDGKRIAFIGGLMSDQGATGGDVWVIDAKGGQSIDITPKIDGTPTYISWTGNDNIGFVEDRRGHTLLADYSVSTRSKDAEQDLGETTLSGGAIKNAISVSTHGDLTFVKSGPANPPEIWAGPFGAQKQITHLNDAAKPAAKMESINWDNEGFHVQGWLTYPVNYDPAKKYPLIVTVHGGPSSSTGAHWASSMWSQQGYFEFQPNPRGSFGQGEAFTAANRKDFGYGDLRDILKGMDTIEAKFPIDKAREGLTGWSYGGFMTMFAVTQTHRFRAAVAGAGLSDWLSYYGENSIDQWMIPFFGASVYDDPAVYAKSSAITFVKNAKTPMLIVVGDRDGECPAPQSFEMWHALRDLGVKTQLVVYPNEGHGFRDPAHIKDRNQREIKWFADNMPEK